MVQLGEFSATVLGVPTDSKGYTIMEHGQMYTLKLESHHPPQRKCDAEITIDGKVVGTWRLGGQQPRTIHVERPGDVAKHLTFYLANSKESKKAGISSGKSENGLITVKFVAEDPPPPPKMEAALVVHRVQGLLLPKEKVKTWAERTGVPENVCTGMFGDDDSDEEMGFDPWNPPAYMCVEDENPVVEELAKPSSLRAAKNTLKSASFTQRNQAHRSCRDGKQGRRAREAPVESLREGATGLSGVSRQTFSTVGEIVPDESTRVTINLRLVGKATPKLDDIQPLKAQALSNDLPKPVSVD